MLIASPELERYLNAALLRSSFVRLVRGKRRTRAAVPSTRSSAPGASPLGVAATISGNASWSCRLWSLDIDSSQVLTHLCTINLRHGVGVPLAVGGPQVPTNQLCIPLLAWHLKQFGPEAGEAEVQHPREILVSFHLYGTLLAAPDTQAIPA